MDDPKLIFVYNANSGKWNGYLDILHKIVSPATYPCKLCDLTHGIFKVRQEWVSFKETIDIPMEFLHKDEWLEKYQTKKDLPAVFSLVNGQLNTVIDAKSMEKMDLNDLQEKLKEASADLSKLAES